MVNDSEPNGLHSLKALTPEQEVILSQVHLLSKVFTHLGG